MKQKLQAHWNEYRLFYIGTGVGLALAGITYGIVKHKNGKSTYWAHSPMESPPTGHIGFIFSDSTISDSTFVNVLERDGRGHPGYLTRCLETGLTYPSQKSAAAAFGFDKTHMSDHLHGRLENLGGYHFERICMAA